jgi:hypothetical protein
LAWSALFFIFISKNILKETMRNFLPYSFAILSFLSLSYKAGAQNNFFTDAKEDAFRTAGQKRVVIPAKYRTVSLDTLSLLNFLKTLPSEKNITSHNNTPVITIPLPNGIATHFHLWESSIMEPALAAKFPNLKTYTGQGIDDRTATIKIDWTEMGFHAMILSPVTTTVFIDPYSQGAKTNYISYFKSDIKQTEQFNEGELPSNSKLFSSRPASPNGYEPAGPCIGTQLRAYRLAVACTHQYAIAATGQDNPTVAQTLSAIMTCINRVDGVYEEELDIHFNLVSNEDAIIFTNANNDPLGNYNSDANSLLTQGQSVIDANIRDANYDLGQSFSTGAGGLTQLAVTCVSGEKAMSATGLANPTGDVYYIDYVAHEIGHEFSAHHPFNSSLGFCGASGQQSSTTNDEPGSGSTIMAYAEGSGPGDPGALCSTDNLQAHSDAYFNAANYDEIENYATNESNCAVISSTGNNPPVVNALANFTIPKLTPFVLTGSATDPDGDSLTYCWEQMNVGGPFGSWDEPSGEAPIFRSFSPVTSTTRYFPQLSDVINNTTTIGEIMPSYARTLHFRMTARDNHAGGGGLCSTENTVTVDGGSGPFKVTYPDTTNIVWGTNDIQTVTWDPANTQAAPVNCSNVMILLSTDSGLTYPDTLLASVENTGSAKVQVPNILTTSARILVMGIGNIFYDISDNNFTIQKSTDTSTNDLPSWRVYFSPDIPNIVNLKSQNIVDANVQVQLFDASGRLMLTKSIGSVIADQIIPISLNAFARGVYVVSIITSSHGTLSRGIIVR